MANIIIVGANQGIGYYIAERLLARGSSVAILDTSLDQAKALQASYPQRLLPVRADARDAASIQSGVAQTVTAFGSIDAAIHNACLCTFASEPDTGYDVYQDVLDVNFFGALRLAKAVLPYMRKAGKGRIIFTSSGVGVTGFVNISPYASSKGAIEALAKCLEIENPGNRKSALRDLLSPVPPALDQHRFGGRAAHPQGRSKAPFKSFSSYFLL